MRIVRKKSICGEILVIEDGCDNFNMVRFAEDNWHELMPDGSLEKAVNGGHEPFEKLYDIRRKNGGRSAILTKSKRKAHAQEVVEAVKEMCGLNESS